MKRFDYPNSQLAQTGHHGVTIASSVDRASEELYNRVGERFPVAWEPWSKGEPVIDPADLPDGVSESDVEPVLADLKSEGIL